ncbi:MAG TPA: hypothetical protein VFB51_03480 [Solirubrobacterales bacterium]|nr:hypothetical protein [Solirubrobacterales bacterium]
MATLAAVLGLAACGGDGGSGSDENATTVINETFSSRKNVNSGKLDMSVTAQLEGTGAAAQLDDPVTIKLAGPFQSRGKDALPEVDLDLSVSGGGQTFTAGALTTGEAAFISYQGTDYRVPDNQFRRYKRQIERDAKRDNQDNSFSFAQLGINPRDWIENPKNEGTQDVGGAKTIHVSADVNVAAFVDDLDNVLRRASSLGVQNQQLPQDLTERQKKQLEEAIQDVRFDLWTGEEDKILRRIEVEFGFDVPRALREDTQGVERGNVKMALEIADVNQEQTINPPSDARPLSELQSTLGLGSLGGLGGSGDSGGSSGGGSGGGGSSGGGSSGGGAGGGSDLGSGGGSSGLDSRRSQRYLDCLGEAKRPADIEKCAAILEE